MYLDEEGLTKPVRDLNKVCPITPVYLILGKLPDFMFILFALSSAAYWWLIFLKTMQCSGGFD